MPHDLLLLAATAATIGFVHTLFGPDHYVPFIALARARRWSHRRTAWITGLCGLGHVASSVLLGLLGIALGAAVSSLEAIESRRGTIAAWALICLGLVYFAWGIRHALRGAPHRHLLPGQSLHRLQHQAHAITHPSAGPATGATLTPWALFVVFLLGPCEPLIPLLMYPAATTGIGGALLVTAVFAVTTIATMLGVVWLGLRGVGLLGAGRLERYAHAVAGATIVACGVGVQMLGL